MSRLTDEQEQWLARLIRLRDAESCRMLEAIHRLEESGEAATVTIERDDDIETFSSAKHLTFILPAAPPKART